MNGAGPVLRDIHLPTATWWPLAPAWWFLSALVALAAAAAIVGLLRHRRGGVLRAVLRELDRLEAEHARNPASTLLADRASRLLRRVARRVEPSAVAASGEAWRAFVLRYARGPAVRDALDALLDARFRANPVLDAPAVLSALRAWCRAALRRGIARRVPEIPT